ncbi:CotH kinase family protein [Alkalitalea saponilacus]|uniref:Por secretion system C-terminal sorting domain-containing protein n=1 Tax=Alkalitalea saponilacus TaxID=889453 RepID=A0A1T5FIY5_9BACT|nr:CotH kinase family protein [Alkalitalea saponilacus]ASB49406.1 hypothetical protein CDL62_09790 [Alkalitalea saponilacus]SKB96077.1 Por secretion system C-terminal sorting domain-containing protein [Alkalitalea saponilacus]
MNSVTKYNVLSYICIMAIFFLLQIPAKGQNSQFTIVLNELMSSNSNTIADEDGDFEDWIEIYNYGDDPINLNGWGLSDDENNLFRWVFPDVTIAPGEYRIIWASGKDRRPNDGAAISGLRRDVYQNISGTSVDDLINSPDYPHSPSFSEIVTEYFEAPVNVDDHYGQRMHGLLKPPATGYYTFWIASDDNSRLYISSHTDHSDLTRIALVPQWTSSRQWDKYPEQQSAPIHLLEGEYYYVVALMKEHDGGDNLAVRWQLPDGAIEEPMPASRFYLISDELHTNFAISSDGEPIILTEPEGEIVHMVPSTPIPTDVSLGLNPNEDGFFFFNNPTPGSANTSTAFLEIITDSPVFSHTGGFYNESFDLQITSSHPDATIIYTLDGSAPDPLNVGGSSYHYKNSYPDGNLLTRETRSHIYDEPLNIYNRSSEPYQLAGINTQFEASPRLPNSNIFKGTVVRAMVYNENAITTKSASHTYFISPQGAERYSLPVISITTDEPHLFDYDSGIYVAGRVADEWWAQNPGAGWNGGRPANYNQRGIEWEYPAHLEVFPEDGQPVFSQNIGIRTHGGWSRANPMKSLRFYARNQYDDSNTLNYPFFGKLQARGNPNATVDQFRRLIIRNSGNDHYRTMYRDALMQELVKHLPFTIQAYQPAIHFINGEFWGIINIRERYDQHYIHSHYGVDPEDVVILEAWGSVDIGLPADSDQFYEILNYAENFNLNFPARYQWVKDRVDIESLAHYYATQIYFYNTDWPQNNMTFWRKRVDSYQPNAAYGHDGRWRWMMYDVDFGMNLYGNHTASNGLSRVMSSNASDPSSRLFRQLLGNNEFRDYFINIIADHLNTCFQPDRVHNLVDEFNDILAPHRSEHWNRWRHGTDTGNDIKTFATGRPNYMRSHLRSQFGLEQPANLTVNRTGEGVVKVNSVIIDENTPGLENAPSPYPWSGIYFRNTPIQLSAIDKPGYRFLRWEGNIQPSQANSREIQLTIAPNENAISVTAVFEQIPEPTIIHLWHFNSLSDDIFESVLSDLSETESPGRILYSGESDGYMDRVTDGSLINLPGEIHPGYALRVRNPSDTRELILEAPTDGFKEIVLKYAVKRTVNGATKQKICYRTLENGSWTTIADNISVLEDYRLVTVDFSEISGANNNPEFAVRITFTDEAAENDSGNNRFDNITFSARDISTNLNGSLKTNSFNVFPNPASDFINIISADPIKTVAIYDINGRILKSFREDDFSNQRRLNLHGLANGIYLLEIVTTKEKTTEKLIIR